MGKREDDMRAILTVDMDGAAFDQDEPGDEFARLLSDLARRIEKHGGSQTWRGGNGAPIALFDRNGNRVGELRIED